MTDKLYGMRLFTEMEKAVTDALVHKTGIVQVKEDGSVVHIPYEDIVKVVTEARSDTNKKLDGNNT